MMKFVLRKTVLFISIFCLMFVSTVFAEDTSEKLPIEIVKEAGLQKILEMYPDAQIISEPQCTSYEEDLRDVSSSEAEDSGDVSPQAAAPPVTYLKTLEVWSESTGLQDVSDKYVTPVPVGGYTYLGTLVVGFGRNTMYLEGEEIRDGHPDYEYEMLFLDFNQDTIVDAIYYIIGFNSDVKIPNGGTYTHYAKSHNFPWNEMSTYLSILHE